MKTKFIQKFNFSKISERFLLVLALVLLNLVGQRAFFRIDLTRQKSYSLSKASVDVIKSLDSPLSVKVFFSQNLPAPYNTIEQYILDLLQEYKSKSNKNFSYQTFDMSSQENQQMASDFGLGSVQIDNIETTGFSSKIAWMGLVITYGDYIATINSLKNTSDIEYKLTTSISKIISMQSAKKENLFEVGYITGHNETSLEPNRYAQTYYESSASNLKTNLSDIYSIKNIDITTSDIPSNLTAIIINSPKENFSTEELTKIENFISNGGNAIFFVDPLIETYETSNQYPLYTKPNTNIDLILSKYGINIQNSYIMDENCFTQNQSGYGKQFLNWAPLVSKDNLAKNNPITQNLSNLIFFCNGPIDITNALNNKNVKTTVLATSSNESYLKDSEIILYPGYNLMPKDYSSKKENLAVLLEGKLTSSSNNESKIIVVSSSIVTTDILFNAECTEPIALFVRNCIDYVNNNEDFCTMRTKGQRLDFISVKSERFANIIKLLNEFGLAIVVLLVGFFVWRINLQRKNLIYLKYNKEEN